MVPARYVRQLMKPDGRHPLVSTIIPCYKQAHLLGDAIESVRSQSWPCIEVVVVDDGSPDDPAAVVRRYPGVQLVEQPNRGLPAARNAGLRVSRGDYVVFLDADDLLLPHAVETGMLALLARPACAFVHGWCERRLLDGTPLPSRPPVVGDIDLYLELLRGNCIRGTHSVVFRRAAIEAVGGFDEARLQAQDWDLYLRIARCYPTYGHGQLVGMYRRHGANVNSVRHADRMLRHSMAVLAAQRQHVRGSVRHKDALRAGIGFIHEILGEPLMARLSGHVHAGRWRAALRDGATLLRYYPRGVLAHAIAKLRRSVAGGPRVTT